MPVKQETNKSPWEVPACDPHGHINTEVEKYPDINGILLFCVFVYMHVCICFWHMSGWFYTCAGQRMDVFLNGSPHYSLGQASEHRSGRRTSLFSKLSLESYLYFLSAGIKHGPLWFQCWYYRWVCMLSWHLWEFQLRSSCLHGECFIHRSIPATLLVSNKT